MRERRHPIWRAVLPSHRTDRLRVLGTCGRLDGTTPDRKLGTRRLDRVGEVDEGKRHPPVTDVDWRGEQLPDDLLPRSVWKPLPQDGDGTRHECRCHRRTVQRTEAAFPVTVGIVDV